MGSFQKGLKQCITEKEINAQTESFDDYVCYFSRKYKLCRREPPQPVGFNKPHWQNVSMADLNNRFEDLGAVGVTPAYPPPPPTQVVPTGAKTRFEARLAALESASRMAALKTAVEEG